MQISVDSVTSSYSLNQTQTRCAGLRRLPQACVPGMARYFMGASPMARFITQSRRQGEGQGRRREAGSGGSPIRTGGAMNKSRI